MAFSVTRLHLTFKKILWEYMQKLQFLGKLHFDSQLLQQQLLHSSNLSHTAVFIDSTELTFLSKPLKIPMLPSNFLNTTTLRKVTYKHHRENIWIGPIKKLLCLTASIERDGPKGQYLLDVRNAHRNI